jgi:hypothetical protein
MERATLQNATRAGRIALLCAIAGMSASAMAYTMPGGTITFRGALVAPQFMVATQTASASSAMHATGATNGDVTTVTFLPPPNSAPSADVSLDGQTQARFVDGRGHITTPGARGAWHIGASGGTLTMQGSAAKTVTLVTNYN